MRSFAWTLSISSFHRLTETSVPSSSTAFASATFPVEPLRLEKSRVSPFCRIVSSMTSTLLSGRSSLTFIRPAPRTPGFRLNISPVPADREIMEGERRAHRAEAKVVPLKSLRAHDILLPIEIKLITAHPDIERVGLFEYHQRG